MHHRLLIHLSAEGRLGGFSGIESLAFVFVLFVFFSQDFVNDG